MTGDEDRLHELRELASQVARTGHDDLPAGTIDAVGEFASEVESQIEHDESLDGARTLLAFWESFVHTKLEMTDRRASDIADETIPRFEQAFDEDVIGVDLYQALETLAIVEDMEEPAEDQDRLAQWAARVQALTEEFADHLEGHK